MDSIDIRELYQLLGEKDVRIYQLEKAKLESESILITKYNQLLQEKSELEKKQNG